MKFFHLSDLHIGLKLMNRDLREDQEYILRQIVRAVQQEQPDALLIAGDIYDKAVPSAEAVEVFDGFIDRLTEAAPSLTIMAVSGNHDSGPRIDCFRSVLARQRLHMVGMPPVEEDGFIQKVVLTDAFGQVCFYLLPFVRPSMVKQAVGTKEDGSCLSYDETLRRLIGRETIDEKVRNVLVSHQFYLPSGSRAEDVERMDSEIRMAGNIDEVSADVLQVFDYAALGHIHKPMQVCDENHRYCGTPMACSVSEAGQEKGIVMVEMREKGDIRTTVLPLVPLRQIRVIRGSYPEVLEQACEDYVSVILTDKVDLDVIDMQERMRLAYPNLLEIRRETQRRTENTEAADTQLDPFQLCSSFLKDLDDGEKDILRDVINSVLEGR